MPLERALGGRKERKSRAALALAEKGLKRVDTSVMKRVSMLGEVSRDGGGGDLRSCWDWVRGEEEEEEVRRDCTAHYRTGTETETRETGDGSLWRIGRGT